MKNVVLASLVTTTIAHAQPVEGEIEAEAPPVAEQPAPAPAPAPTPEVEPTPHETVKPPRKHHIRMALELAAIFTAGNRWYWRDNGKPNEVDWQLPFDGRALEAKLLSTNGWRFDGNPYYINALGHPGFGMLTHFLARENGYGIGEAFLISTLASGTWEVFLEWQEYGSLNDLAMTSPAGIPLGETAYQIIHHLRETSFELRSGVGNDNGATVGVIAARADLDLIPTTGEGTFRGGRRVSLAAEMPFDDGVRGVEAGAKSTIAGYYQNRDNHQLVAAVSTELDYRNQFDRTERPWDLLSTIAVGPSFDMRWRVGDVVVDTGADLYADFALVKSQAFDSWRADHAMETVRNVMQANEQPYYFAAGLSLDPRINVAVGNYRAGAKLVGSLFESIDGADRDQEMMTADLHIRDYEGRAEAWFGYDLRGVSLLVDGRIDRRGGSLDGVRHAVDDRTVMATLGYRI